MQTAQAILKLENGVEIEVYPEKLEVSWPKEGDEAIRHRKILYMTDATSDALVAAIKTARAKKKK